MKIPYSWLRDYTALTVPPEVLAEKLAMAGLEAKRLEKIGGDWGGITIGQVLSIQPHPSADRLRLATVDLGQRQLTVVCGAPNVASGQKVPFALSGARLIDLHTGQPFKLKPAKIRGVVSEGMILSEKELGISQEAEGIMVLPADAPVGVALADYLGDTVLDMEVTPNRPDCLSVIGVAREAAALTGQAVTLPQVPEEVGQAASVPISIIDEALCPRYCAALIAGVHVGPSPSWMQQRLTRCGMRPINNIVDITNYVMLEYGQPLHAFDYSKLKGGKIIVRRAGDGERITSLDGVERKLNNEDLVIADEERAVAIAGVMGGATSEVSPETTSILLESASFSSAGIRRTSARLNLRTEASVRFERRLSAGVTLPAIRRAVALIAELAGGKPAGSVIDLYPGKKESQPIAFGTADVKRLLGIDMGIDEIERVLVSLGFQVRRGDGQADLLVDVPYWRSDVQLKADLAEEVARISGYDRIPTTTLGGGITHAKASPLLLLKERVKDIMASYGFCEVLTYSMVSLESLSKLAPEAHVEGAFPLRLANPMSPEQEYLRTTLKGAILAALASNQRYEKDGIRLFEIGKVYLPRKGDLPEEPERLCAVLCGRRGASWLDGNEPVDFFDAKGVVEGMLARLGLEAGFIPASDETLNPISTARFVVDGVPLGILGEVDRKVAASFDVTGRAYLIELYLDGILSFVARDKKFTPLPRFPSVTRDVALVVDEDMPAGKIQTLISGSPLVSQVALFDVYTGAGLDKGKKSLAYHIVYQSSERTLTEEEVNAIQERMVAKLRELGAIVRGS